MGSRREQGRVHDPYRPDAPGWYPDPWSATGVGERYYDGTQWGTTERPRGRHTADLAPTPRRSGKMRVLHLPRLRTAGIIVVIGALAVVMWLVQGSPNESSSGSTAATFAHPPAGTEESPHRLQPKPAAVEGPGEYEFNAHHPGARRTPVAWDPCRPIHYVIDPRGAPDDGLELVQSAVARLQGATGLQFRYDGPTDEAPTRDRALYLPRRYDASRWAPVLIAWSDETSFPLLAGPVSGVGSPREVRLPDGRSVYVSGSVVLDQDALAITSLTDRALARAIVLHELGHLVGLDHTSDHTQLMFSEAQLNVVDYGAGDLRGLAREGSQECFPEV